MCFGPWNVWIIKSNNDNTKTVDKIVEIIHKTMKKEDRDEKQERFL